MKLIKIDVEKQSVYEVEHDGSLKSIYKLLGAECFCIGATFENRDVIMVDDEGLLHDSIGWFQLKPGTQPLAGNGLVCGTDDNGDTVPPKVTLAFIKSICRFFKPGEITPPEPFAEVQPFDTLEEMLKAQKDLREGKGELAGKIRRHTIRSVRKEDE